MEISQTGNSWHWEISQISNHKWRLFHQNLNCSCNMYAYHQLYQCKSVGGVYMGVMSLKFNPPTLQVSVIGGFHILKILGKYPPMRLMRLQISSRRTTQTSSVFEHDFSVVNSIIKMKWIRNDKEDWCSFDDYFPSVIIMRTCWVTFCFSRVKKT